MRDLWVICALPLHTKSVTKNIYGIRGSMGFQGYGLRGLRLYHYCSTGMRPMRVTAVNQTTVVEFLPEGDHVMEDSSDATEWLLWSGTDSDPLFRQPQKPAARGRE